MSEEQTPDTTPAEEVVITDLPSDDKPVAETAE